MIGRGKRSKTGSPPPGEAPPAPSHMDPDRLLDVIARLLRACGEHPIVFDDRNAEELGALFEGWARHALTAAPVDGGKPRPEGDRNWSGLERFFREHREQEAEAVDRSRGDLGEVIWLFIRGLGRALADDRASDSGIESQLGGLAEAVASGDTERLKQEALHSIQLIETRIRERRARESSHIQELTGQLSLVTHELMGVRSRLGTDSLTNIANRAALDEHLKRVVSLAAVVGEPAYLFMIDVDDFKWVNDNFGHPAGDAVLQAMADALAGVFRRRGDFVARYGGDEFSAVILDDAPEVVQAIADRMLFAVRDLEVRISEEGEPIRISASIGGTALRPEDDATSWMERADVQLYRSKEAGRDRATLEPPVVAPGSGGGGD